MLVEEKIISKELAFLAYDKGFDCYGWSAFMYESKWHEEDDSYELENFDFRIPNKYWNEKLKFCPQSLLQKWLREVHCIDIVIMTTYSFRECLKEINTLTVNENKTREYSFMIFQNVNIDSEEYATYEDCLEEALMVGLSLI